MLQTLAAKPIAFDWAGEAHAVGVKGHIAFVAKQNFSFAIVPATHGAWALVARHIHTGGALGALCLDSRFALRRQF